MLLKALAVVKSHMALAVLGGLLLAGGSSAVALAASQGYLGGVGGHQSSKHNGSEGKNGASHDRAHAEGKLTACDASTATVGTISVTDEQGQVHVFSVTGATRFNGDIHASSASASQGKGASGAGAAPNFDLKDLCALVNKVKVQAQATATTTGSKTTFTAVKITVQGADGAQGDGPEPTEAPEGTPDAGHD